MKVLATLLLGVFPLMTLADIMADPVVAANGEQLRGEWVEQSDIAVFKGIPFAAPPVGELRWRRPRPHVPRDGEQLATEFAAACMQGSHIVDWYADVAEVFGGSRSDVGRPNGVSEDCLYLNVWTPDLGTDEKLPVMIWFHGGSNKGGWSYEPNYIGDRLAARGVVVVTMAYRLGPFGFFSHPAMRAGGDESLANFAYHDAWAALEWVHANIAAFGGDPNNITTIGESSGAGDLASMLAAEMSTGLFRRAIAQSPGSDFGRIRTLADEQRNGQMVANELGFDNDPQVMKKLRAIPATELIEASERVLPGHYYDMVIDEQTITASTLAGLERSDNSKVDLLIGTNADEWYMYTDPATDMAAVNQWLDDNAPGAAERLLARTADETEPRRVLDRLETASNMLCPARRAAGRVTAGGGRAFMYYFSRRRPGAGGEKFGAYHGAEIPYVFDQHDDWLPTDATDRQLTDVIMDYWVQFARTGDPNLPGRPEWPVYQAGKPLVMELGDQIRAVPPPDAELCLWLGPQ